MVVIHRAHGFRFVITLHDHEPAHVHIIGAGLAKVHLLGPGGRSEVVDATGIKACDMARGSSRRWQSAAASSCGNGSASMAELTDAEFEAAQARGREKLRIEPRAVAARFERETGRVVVELANGCTHIFPPRLAQELEGAGDDELAGVVVDGAGFNLHWPALDADLYVPALVAGVFGTRDWMAKEWARMAGSAATPAKAAAARANGAKGGRPRKSGAG